MNRKQTVCLLNDSFPPLIDGVANTVMNYAAELPGFGYESMVVTPAHPHADDSAFSYPVARYPSISTQKFEGYPAGIPFSPEVAGKIRDTDVALLHTHCPVMSTFMARQLRQITKAPVVFTYHTKFDVDIANITKSPSLQTACKKRWLPTSLPAMKYGQSVTVQVKTCVLWDTRESTLLCQTV